MRLSVHVFTAIAIASIFENYASAAPAVAILGSPNGGATWNADVQTKLISTGLFSSVSVFDISTTTPTLSQLQAFGSVLVYSDGAGYQDSTALGNNLADYVDGGGGVVVGVFANASVAFGGRFASSDYWGIEPANQTQNVDLHLGTIHVPSSPILAGVTSFDGGSASYRSTGGLQASATDVADWSDGSPLIVTRTIGLARRVDLNYFPVSSDQNSGFWQASTDGARLTANALLFAAVPEPSSLTIAALGLIGFATWRWRKRGS
jgi:PEP-CTERM motif-containing protein